MNADNDSTVKATEAEKSTAACDKTDVGNKRGVGTGWFKFIIDVCKGAAIGVGAILPGISGGVLCVVFGIYRPMMEFLSHPFVAFKKYRWMLLPVFIGLGIGFLGLARLVDILFRYSQTPAVWLFIGLIVGTIPSLYRTAGEQGRTKGSWAVLVICFAAFLVLMFGLSGGKTIEVRPTVWWWVLSGALWGIGLIVPGMSASPFLIFLGLYQPMTAGIADFDPSVVLPLIAGIGIVVLLLARVVNRLFERAHSIVFHALLGIVAASVIAIIPLDAVYDGVNIAIYTACFVVGIVIALLMDKASVKIDRAAIDSQINLQSDIEN
ncbi:MAG: DUF368 domain-containing protein [Oscillospiraceae bacterium]